MINLLSSFVLFTMVFLLTLTERRYKSFLTPFSVTAWPFAIISIIVNIFAVRINFLPITTRVNFFLMLNLFFIWLVGFIMSHFYDLSKPKTDYRPVFTGLKKYRLWIYVFSWLVISVVALKIFSILNTEGWRYLGDDQFEKDMIVGFHAHMIQFGKALLIVLILMYWDTSKSILFYLTSALLVLTTMSTFVKYHIVWIILVLFFIKNHSIQPKRQLRKISLISLSVAGLFIGNYIVLTIAWNTFSVSNPLIWEFILGWLYNYLMSGPILLDNWMDMAYSKPWWSLFIVPINFFNVIIGDPERLSTVTYVTPGFLQVSPEFTSNVGTSFGVFYIIGGFVFTILMTFFISMVSYHFFFKSQQSKSPFTIYFNALFLMLGILSFFVQYFTLLSLYEMTFFYVFLIGFFRLLNIISGYEKKAELKPA